MLNREPVGRAYHLFFDLAEGGGLMSTYEELQIILTFALLVVTILNLKNKK